MEHLGVERLRRRTSDCVARAEAGESFIVIRHSRPERLAAKRDRPALATPVVNTVIRPLANWLRGNAGLREAAKVDELRLAIAPSRLDVERAGLLVLTNDEPLPTADRAPWEPWWGRTRPRAADAGIDLLANQYESYETLTARAYRNAVSLDFGYLSRGV